jgi:hypothetical protein
VPRPHYKGSGAGGCCGSGVQLEAVEALLQHKDDSMQPEWSGDPEVGPMFMLVSVTGLVCFLLLVWVFAFYM